MISEDLESKEESEEEKEHEEYEFVRCLSIDFSNSIIIKELGKKTAHFKEHGHCSHRSNDTKQKDAVNAANDQMMRIIDDNKLNKQISNDGSVFLFTHK